MSKLRFRLSTPAEVRKSLARIVNMLANGDIEPKTANAIVIACNAILSSIRTDEQQRQIEEMERRLDELEDGDTAWDSTRIP
jgi:hypothetical protein